MVRGRGVALPLAVLLAGTTVGGSLTALLPFLLQNVWGRPAAVAGAVLLVQPAGMVAVSWFGGVLADRFGAWRVQLAGAATLVLGVALVLTVVHTKGPIGHAAALVATLAVVGIGSGLMVGPNGALLMAAVPAAHAGSAGALAGLARTGGFALGPTLAALSWQTSDTGFGGIQTGLLGAFLVTGVALAAALASSQSASPRVAAQPPRPSQNGATHPTTGRVEAARESTGAFAARSTSMTSEPTSRAR